MKPAVDFSSVRPRKSDNDVIKWKHVHVLLE
jgi:hypothetical protein